VTEISLRERIFIPISPYIKLSSVGIGLLKLHSLVELDAWSLILAQNFYVLLYLSLFLNDYLPLAIASNPFGWARGEKWERVSFKKVLSSYTR